MTDSPRPPIPGSCQHRPVHGGLVVPYAQIVLADGTPDFLTPHHATTARCWAEGLCQICGGRLTRPAVLAGGPRQLTRLHFDEAPMCPPCAIYSSRACPMFGGRRTAYTTHGRLSEGRRGQTCPDPNCGCGGFTPTDPGLPGHGGEPAHAYYACYAEPGAWVRTAKDIKVRCTDGGCHRLHDRRVTTGAFLAGPPLKTVLVSEPGRGRTWRTLTPAEVAGLVTDPWYATAEAAEVMAG